MTEFKRKAFIKEFPRVEGFLEQATDITVKRIDKNLLNQIGKSESYDTSIPDASYSTGIVYYILTKGDKIRVPVTGVERYGANHTPDECFEGMSILEMIYRKMISPADILCIVENDYSNDYSNITIYKPKEAIHPLITQALNEAEKELRSILENI